MKQIAAVLLILFALIMFYLAYDIGGLPPAITEVGFLVIAVVWLKEKK